MAAILGLVAGSAAILGLTAESGGKSAILLARYSLSLKLKHADSISVAEPKPEPVEMKLFEIWSRSLNYLSN